MLTLVRDAFLQEKRYQAENSIRCSSTVDSYTDFIFVNRFGNPQHQGTLNKALRRIIRDCNDEILQKAPENPLLLPHFSCHILRHTFTTRLCEAGVNVKVIQDTLDDANALLKSAGFALSNSSSYDLAIHYCLEHRVHELAAVNMLLEALDEKVFS